MSCWATFDGVVPVGADVGLEVCCAELLCGSEEPLEDMMAGIPYDTMRYERKTCCFNFAYVRERAESGKEQLVDIPTHWTKKTLRTREVSAYR